MSSQPDTYALGRTERETRRLILQHQIYGPITRRFFSVAGIGPGMKVLDVGSGAGDVALLLADLVGPRGQVTGIDENASILEFAGARARTMGWSNVTFQAGDVREIHLDSDFDAVVGRWVLMYVPKPADLLRNLARHLRPGGIAAFHENDFTYPPTAFPSGELDQKLRSWSIPPPGTPGPEMRMGTKLFRTFVEAGLPEPQIMVEAPAGGGASWPGYEYVAETIRSLLPMLQKLTGLDPEDVNIDTLAERLRAEVTAARGVHMLPLMFGAWTRVRQGS